MNKQNKKVVKQTKTKSENFSGKRPSKSEFQRDHMDFDKRCNDVSWYVSDDQLLKDVASFSFAQMAGNYVVDGPYLNRTSDTNNQYLRQIPGIMRIGLEPTVGGGDSPVDAPSVAARTMYTFIRHANSGSANYESPDLYFMILAHCSAQSWLEELKRLYGMCVHYSARNRYYGKVLVSAMGYNYEKIITDLPALRNVINIAAKRLNSIKIPSGLGVNARWNWIAQSIYTDANSLKAQMYVYRFNRYLKFDGYGSSTGTQLIPVSPYIGDYDGAVSNDLPVIDATLLDLEGIRKFTDSLIEPLIYEEDVGIMSGDIMKAFGDKVVEIAGIDEYFETTPVYNTEVLEQIHNLKICSTPDVRKPSLHSITQTDGNTIVERITYNTDPSFVSEQHKHILQLLEESFLYDSYTDSPTPAQVMVGTRLTPAINAYSDYGGCEIVACGSEIVNDCKIFTFSVGVGPDGQINPTTMYVNSRSVYYLMNDIQTIAGVSAFDWHPRLVVGNTEFSVVAWLGDLENYTVISNSNLINLHKVAILSELAYTK